MVETGECFKTFSKADETDGKGSVFKNFADFVIFGKFFGIDPDSLTHKEGIVADFFLLLNFKSFKKLFDYKRNLAVELVEEEIDVVVGKNCKSRKVDGSEGKVSAAGNNFSFRIVNVSDNSGAASHICNFGFRMSFFIILKVIGSIDEGEVREKAFCADFAGKFKEVIVGFARVIVDSLFNFEDMNRENGGFAVSKTCFGCFKDIFDNKSAFRGGVGTVVDGAERNLCARSGMHGVKVMNKSFHCLEGCAVDFFFRSSESEFLCFNGNFFAVFFFKKSKFGCFINFAVLKFGPFAAKVNGFVQNFFRYAVAAFFVCKKFKSAAKVLAIDFFIGFCNAGSHSVIEVGDALTAVLVVLVGLDSDACKSRIACDILGFTKMAVAGVETVFEKFKDIDLAAGGGESKEVKVMNMNIAVVMCLCMTGIKDIHFIELFCGFASVFKHGAHGGVAVYVCVFAFNVVFLCRLESEVFHGLHKAGVHFADFVAVCTVKDIALCGAGMSGFDKHFFNNVLNVFNVGSFDMFFFFYVIYNGKSNGHCFLIVASSVCFCGHENSVCDLINIKICNSSVTFYNSFDHIENLLYYFEFM